MATDAGNPPGRDRLHAGVDPKPKPHQWQAGDVDHEQAVEVESLGLPIDAARVSYGLPEILGQVAAETATALSQVG